MQNWSGYDGSQEHLTLLRQGSMIWNKWREQHPDQIPDFVEANLIGAYLARALFTKANLFRANLSDTSLYRADLQQANLRHAQLKGSLLRWANLRDVDFTGANLQDANLCLIDLEGACFTDADLRGAWFSDENASLFRDRTRRLPPRELPKNVQIGWSRSWRRVAGEEEERL
jgi:uncharacterized protein YjbI with pentapeptide repeats